MIFSPCSSFSCEFYRRSFSILALLRVTSEFTTSSALLFESPLRDFDSTMREKINEIVRCKHTTQEMKSHNSPVHPVLHHNTQELKSTHQRTLNLEPLLRPGEKLNQRQSEFDRSSWSSGADEILRNHHSIVHVVVICKLWE